jgi:prenyltransferase beta subunit
VTTVTEAPLGVGTGEPDLWCTYAAVRTLSWLDSLDGTERRDATLAYLVGRQNADGGYAWSKGMPSDAWATYYCLQAISDLGGVAPHQGRTADWLRATAAPSGGYGMVPGQTPDVWATHFSTRVAAELFGIDVPDRAGALRWLAELQAPDGGLTWSPQHAVDGRSDARACHYGVAAWRALRRVGPADPPWDVPSLIGWLRGRQDPGGGFRFTVDAGEPCLWATFRATTALRLLGAAPDRTRDCVAWIDERRGETGSYVRWAGYPVEDVWAAFCAVGALRALDARSAIRAEAVRARIAAMACPGGGYTYREPAAAADALSTAAAVLCRRADDPELPRLRSFLDGCQLPNEGGIMYMPGRGAEVRCTLWTLAAGGVRDPAARARVASWLAGLQNPDGGFGYWEGRGSDLVSSAAAAEICVHLGRLPGNLLDGQRLASFVDSCRAGNGFANVPGGEPGLRSGLHAHQIRAGLGACDADALAALLDRHGVRGGGFDNHGNRVPDLISTYDAVATADRFGVTVDETGLRALLDRIATASGVAWTPLAPAGGGVLADCLGHLLARRLDSGDTLPLLALS